MREEVIIYTCDRCGVQKIIPRGSKTPLEGYGVYKVGEEHLCSECFDQYCLFIKGKATPEIQKMEILVRAGGVDKNEQGNGKTEGICRGDSGDT